MSYLIFELYFQCWEFNIYVEGWKILLLSVDDIINANNLSETT